MSAPNIKRESHSAESLEALTCSQTCIMIHLSLRHIYLSQFFDFDQAIGAPFIDWPLTNVWRRLSVCLTSLDSIVSEPSVSSKKEGPEIESPSSKGFPVNGDLHRKLDPESVSNKRAVSGGSTPFKIRFWLSEKTFWRLSCAIDCKFGYRNKRRRSLHVEGAGGRGYAMQIWTILDPHANKRV